MFKIDGELSKHEIICMYPTLGWFDEVKETLELNEILSLTKYVELKYNLVRCAVKQKLYQRNSNLSNDEKIRIEAVFNYLDKIYGPIHNLMETSSNLIQFMEEMYEHECLPIHVREFKETLNYLRGHKINYITNLTVKGIPQNFIYNNNKHYENKSYSSKDIRTIVFSEYDEDLSRFTLRIYIDAHEETLQKLRKFPHIIEFRPDISSPIVVYFNGDINGKMIQDFINPDFTNFESLKSTIDAYIKEEIKHNNIVD